MMTGGDKPNPKPWGVCIPPLKIVMLFKPTSSDVGGCHEIRALRAAADIHAAFRDLGAAVEAKEKRPNPDGDYPGSWGMGVCMGQLVMAQVG
jgi:hypothetical protein